MGFSPVQAVVGGTAAEEGEFPFMASLQYATDDFAFCGGSVVASHWVLTAAHCVVDHNLQEEPLQVVTGRTDLTDESSGQVIRVKDIRVHPNYDPNSSANDVALVLMEAATRSPAIRLADASDDDLEADGVRVTVAGWGDITPTLGLLSTSQLQYADLAVVGDDECAQTNGIPFSFDAPTAVCAEALLKDSCQGDSGGPLWGVKDGTRIQIGVVSYGLSCATPEFPGVYSELNNPGIANWISSTVNFGSTSTTTTTKKPRGPKK